MKWVEVVPPAPRNVKTDRSFGLVDSETTAPFAITIPDWKLMVEMFGSGAPDGKSRRWPLLPGPNTVTFRAAAFAPTGTPHTPWTWKSRVVLATRAPPTPDRVSTSRHGV